MTTPKIEPLAHDNPFRFTSTLPCGLPDYARIREEHFLPAILSGIAVQRAELDVIAADSEPATVENTLVALERSGQLLDRALNAFENQASADTNPTLQDIEEQVAPLLAAHHDETYLNRRLFARLNVLSEARAELALDADTEYLLDRYIRDFIRAGVQLSDDDQGRMREINTELTSLETEFDKRLLADTNELALHIEDAGQLVGLSEDAVAAALRAAHGRELSGYLLELVLPTQQPATAALADRDTRERLQEASVARGTRGNGNDTSELVRTIAMLRAERAALLGFENHAAYIVDDGTAKTSEAVMEMLLRVAPAAIANAKVEADALEVALRSDDPAASLTAADWAFYAERVRRERFEIDDAMLRPYFELERVLQDGVFYAAHRLYGLQFLECEDLQGYHPEVRIFEVRDENGSELGLFLADYFTRDSKRGGAWMNELVLQSHLLRNRPVVVNNLNIAQAPEGSPTFLTFDEVGTMFHEFGHALHGLFSNVRYPSQSGTLVPRDFVEFPSQVNEMWALDPEVLNNYAKHQETGESLPSEVVQRLLSSAQFNEGFATTEYLAAALLDQAWHQLASGEDPGDVNDFEADALARFDLALSAIPPRYRSGYFAHIFAGGYSAGYYSYIWSEVLDADTVEWFRENGGLTRANGDAFRAELLSRGGSVDPMEAYRAFRGRDAKIEPLLVRRGLNNV